MRRHGQGPFGWRRVGRPVDWVVAFGLLFLLAIGAAELQKRFLSSRELVGLAEAIDGDSLRLGGVELRLEGLDAPEYRQRCTDAGGRETACGREARRALAILLARGIVSCTVSRNDRYGRGLARCRQGETDINATLVSQGQALAYGGYHAEEEAARAARRGIWAQRFERPEEWRRRDGR